MAKADETKRNSSSDLDDDIFAILNSTRPTYPGGGLIDKSLYKLHHKVNIGSAFLHLWMPPFLNSAEHFFCTADNP